MSKIEVDQIDPSTGTNLTVGSSGDTVTVTGNVVKTNAVQASDAGNIISQSGTTNTIGASGDTIKSATGSSVVIQGDGSSANGLITLNCSQNSHGVKLSSPDHSGGQSYTMKLPATNITAGKFLKVDSISGSGATAVGQLSFADEPGGGAMVKLGETNVTSGTASVTFDGLFSSTYPNYKLIITDLISASSVQARLRVMIGGSESSVNEYYSAHASVQGSSSGGSLDGSRIWPNTSFQLLNHAISTNTREVSMFYIDIPNPLYASSNPTFSQRHMVNNGNSSVIVAGTGGYFYYAQTAISGVKFFMNSGNINYGNFYLYGIKD